MPGDDHDVSVPPSPPPPRMPMASAGERPHQPGDLQDALRIAREARGAVQSVAKELAESLGREPDPKVEGDEGTGIRGRLAMVESFVGAPPDPVRKRDASGMIAIMLAVQATLEGLQKELGADREARERSAAARSRIAWGIGLPVAVAVVLGAGAMIWHWLSTLHH